MASILPWEKASASPQYRNASPEQQAQMRQQYIAAGGTIPEAAPAPSTQPRDEGIARDIGQGITDFFSGAGAGIANRFDTATQGYREMGARLKSQTGNDVLGAPLLRREAAQELQQVQKEEDETKSAYSKRMSDLGTAGKVGAQVGSIGADIAALMVAPEVAIPALGIEATGRAYAEQAPENKSLANAAIVGAATTAANRILPGAFGEEVGGGLARQVLGKAVNTGIAGAKGGAIIGAANELNQHGEDTNAADIATGVIKGGAEGALFGSVLGGVHGAINWRSAPKVLSKAPETAKTDIGAEQETLQAAKASGDTQAYNDTLNQAKMSNTAGGLNLLEQNDFRLTDAVALDHPEAQQLLNTDQTRAEKAFTTQAEKSNAPGLNPFARPKREQGKANADTEHNQTQAVDMVRVMKGHDKANTNAFQKVLDNAEDSLKRARSEGDFVGSDSDLKLVTQNDRDFVDAWKDFSSDANQFTARSPEEMQQFSQKAKTLQDAYNNASPEMQAAADNMKKIKGLSEGFNPMVDAQHLNEASRLMSNQDRGWKTLTAEGFSTVKAPSPTTNPLGLLRYGLNRFTASRARNARVAQQEANRKTIQDLASSDLAVSRSRRAVDQAEADMQVPAEDPIPFEKTPEPERAAPEPAPEAPTNVPDVTAARNLARAQALAEARRRAAQEPTEAPVEPVAEPTGPSAEELRSGARNEAAVAQHRADLERAKQEAHGAEEVAPEPAPEPEPIPVDTRFNREQARQVFRQAMKREPTETELADAEAANNAAAVQAMQERMGNVRDFARRVAKPEAPVEEPTPAPVEEAPAPIEEAPAPRQMTAQELADAGRRVKAMRKKEAPAEEPVVEEAAPVEEAPKETVKTQDLTGTPKKPVKEEAPVEAAPEPVTEEPAPKSEPLPARAPKEGKVAKEDQVPSVPKAEANQALAKLHPQAKAATQLKLDRFKRLLSSPVVKAKATLENIYGSKLAPREFLRRLMSEDNAQNVERQTELAQRQLESQQGIASAKNRFVRDHYAQWVKETGVPEDIARQALKAEEKGPNGNVANLEGLKRRAGRLWQKKMDDDFNRMYEEALKENRAREPKGATLSDQKGEFTSELNNLLKQEHMSPAQKEAVKRMMDEHINDAFKSYEKGGREEGLETGQSTDLWNKFFNEYKRRSGDFLKANKEGQYKMAADAITERENRLKEALMKREAQLKARQTREADKKTLEAIAAQKSDMEALLSKLPEEIRDSNTTLTMRQMASHHDQGSPVPPERYRYMIERIGNNEHTYLERKANASQKDKEEAEEKYNRMRDQANEMNRRFDVEARSKAKKEEESNLKKQNDMIQLNKQREDIHTRLHEALKEHELEGDIAEKLVGSYMDTHYGVLEKPLTPTEYQNARSRIEGDMAKYAKKYNAAEGAEKAKMETVGEGDENMYGEKTAEALKQSQALDDEVKAFREEAQQRQKAKDSMPGSEKEEVNSVEKEVQDKADQEFLQRVETAFKQNKDLNQLANFAEILDRVQGKDTGGNNRRFVEALRTAAANKKKYGDNPITWFTAQDYSNIAKLGSGTAGGNKTRALENIFGTTADEAKRKLMGRTQVEQLRNIVARNPDAKLPNFLRSNKEDYYTFMEKYNQDGTPKQKRGALGKGSAREKLPKTLRVAPKKLG